VVWRVTRLLPGDRGGRDYGRSGSGGGYDSRRGGGGGYYNRDRDSSYSRGMPPMVLKGTRTADKMNWIHSLHLVRWSAQPVHSLVQSVPLQLTLTELHWHIAVQFVCLVQSMQCNSTGISVHRMTTSLESLEMSGNLEHVREMSGMLLTVREKILSWKSVPKLSLQDEY